jgi:hypothetical protein
MKRCAEIWSCPAYVPASHLIYAAFLSKAKHCLTGDLQSKSAERGIVVEIPFAAHPLPGSGLLANHERGDLEAVPG